MKCRESQGTIGENIFKLNIKQDLTLTANPNTDNRGFNSIIQDGVDIKKKLDNKNMAHGYRTIQHSPDSMDSQQKVDMGG